MIQQAFDSRSLLLSIRLLCGVLSDTSLTRPARKIRLRHATAAFSSQSATRVKTESIAVYGWYHGASPHTKLPPGSCLFSHTSVHYIQTYFLVCSRWFLNGVI